MNSLNINNISLKIGPDKILNNISFSINKGSIHALIGDNGAGKTSLIRLILGLIPVNMGEIITDDGIKIEEYRKNIGSVINSIVPDMKSSCLTYLHNVCYMLGINDAGYEKNLLEKVGLSNVKNKPIGKLSYGMKKRLMIACALSGKPQLLVLDEPFNGIDPKGMNEMRLLLQKLRTEGVTILITSHIISELLKVADVYTIIQKGNIVDTISMKNLYQTKYLKIIVRPIDISKFVCLINEKYSDCYFSTSSDDTITIFNMTREEYMKIFDNVTVKKIEQETMNEEDVLLWKMNCMQK